MSRSAGQTAEQVAVWSDLPDREPKHARVKGQNLICGVHGWDYRYDTGISEYDNSEVLKKFTAWVDEADDGLQNFFEARVELMKVMARASGHDSLSVFERRNLTTWRKDIADLTGVKYAGVGRQQ